jgi:hypothetical protein
MYYDPIHAERITIAIIESLRTEAAQAGQYASHSRQSAVGHVKGSLRGLLATRLGKSGHRRWLYVHASPKLAAPVFRPGRSHHSR